MRSAHGLEGDGWALLSSEQGETAERRAIPAALTAKTALFPVYSKKFLMRRVSKRTGRRTGR
jgi:hypothetical protein